jgi:SAM-dependent methyltransferase
MTIQSGTGFEAEWRARFERFAATHEEEAFISGWSEAGLRARVALFASLLPALRLPEGAPVLDLGCGGGTYVRLLAGLGHRVLGVDYSLPSLARATAADPGRKGSYLAGEVYSLPFRNGHFGLVVCIGVLQALTDPERAIGEMARVLGRSGALVVEALNHYSVAALAREGARRLRGRPPRVRTYRPRQVRGWLEAQGLDLETASGLVLGPRRVPRLGRLLATPTVTRAVASTPTLGRLINHSFLFVARKPDGVRPRA